MVDFQGLTNAKPELFENAAQTFSKWSDILDQHAVSLRDQVINQITQPAVWQGDAANAAGRHCDNLRRAAFKTVDEMREIGPILTEAAGEIGAAQRALQAAVAEARSLGFTVGQDGAITVPPMENVPAGQEKAAQEAMTKKQNAANALAGQIHDAIMKASDADANAATALLDSSPDLRDVDKVGDQMRDMEAKGKRAAELAGRGFLSEHEREELLDLLNANSHDPTFAAAMLQQLGPRGVLDFGGNLAILGAGADQALAEQLKQLQTQLGHVLATGTDQRMEPHVDSAWTEELTKAGREKIDIGAFGYQPYGYQLLGAMMHSGTYSAEFLNKVGNDMLAFEREHPGVWAQNIPSGPPNSGFKLNYVDDQGAGFDPMGGLMRAMTQNPEAARQFFDPAQHADTIQYLVNRPAMPDLPLGHPVPKDYDIPFHGYFGDALEAATLHGERDARAAAIATEAINNFGTPRILGDGHSVVPMPDNLKDSVGQTISGYINDVNGAIAEKSDPTWDDPATPGSDEHHAVFDKNKLLAAMGEAAKDPDAYVDMYNAERAYTALTYDYAAGDTGSTMEGRASLLEQYGKNSAQVFGALDHARAEAIAGDNADADKAYNDAIERNGKVANTVLGELVGKVPLVGDGVGAYLDALIENSKHDSSGLSAQETAQLYGDGRHQQKQLAEEAMWQHKMWPPDHPPPASLLPNGPGGDPVPLSQMSDQQKRDFVTWANTSGYSQYIGRVLGELDDSYTTGKNLDEEQRGGR